MEDDDEKVFSKNDMQPYMDDLVKTIMDNGVLERKLDHYKALLLLVSLFTLNCLFLIWIWGGRLGYWR